MPNFITCIRSDALIPAKLDDHVSHFNPFVKFLIKHIEKIPLSVFNINWRENGAAQYHPHVLLATVIFAYCQQVFSSRRIEYLTKDSFAVSYITGGHTIDHATICRFIVNNIEAINQTFVQVLVAANEAGFLSLEHIGMDGTKIKANANINRSMTIQEANDWLHDYEAKFNSLKIQLHQLLIQIAKKDQSDNDDTSDQNDQLFSDWKQCELALKQLVIDKAAINKALAQAKIDAEDKAEYAFIQRKEIQHRNTLKKVEKSEQPSTNSQQLNDSPSNHHTPQSIIEKSKAIEVRNKTVPVVTKEKIKAVRKKALPNDTDRINLTDPTSHRMKPSGKNVIQAYNAQCLLDLSNSRFIVATDVVSDAVDKRLLSSNINCIDSRLNQPEVVVADGGYFNHNEIERLTKLGIESLVNPGKIADTNLKQFKLDMVEKLAKPQNNKLVKARTVVNEGAFAQIKTNMNYHKILRRGLPKVNVEFKLVAIAYNFSRLFHLITS